MLTKIERSDTRFNAIVDKIIEGVTPAVREDDSSFLETPGVRGAID